MKLFYEEDVWVELVCEGAVAVEGAKPSVSGFELAALSAKVFEFGIWWVCDCDI